MAENKEVDDKKVHDKPFIIINSPGELIGIIIALILAFFFVKAFIAASNDPTAYTTPDCPDGTESCN